MPGPDEVRAVGVIGAGAKIPRQQLLDALLLSTGRFPCGAEVLQARSQGDHEFFPAQLAEHVASLPEQITFDELIPPLDWSFSYFQTPETFFRALMAAAVLPPTDGAVVDGDLELRGKCAVCYGTLEVRGDLVLDGSALLVVLGDLHITGAWTTASPWLGVCVTGNVLIGGRASMGGEVYIGGGLTASEVYTWEEGCVGQLKVLGGVSARLLLEDERQGCSFDQLFGSLHIELPLYGWPHDPPDIEEGDVRGLVLPELVPTPFDPLVLARTLIERFKAGDELLRIADSGSS